MLMWVMNLGFAGGGGGGGFSVKLLYDLSYRSSRMKR